MYHALDTRHWGCKDEKDKEPPALMEFTAKQYSMPHRMAFTGLL